MSNDKAAREAYNHAITDDIISIRRNFNLVDDMTKSTILPKCFKATDKN